MAQKLNLFTSMLKSVMYSDTHYDEVISEQDLTDMASSVFANEIGLEADRSVESIGVFPNSFYGYEQISNGHTDAMAVVRLNAMQLEMLLKLAKPTGVLFFKSGFMISPHNYLDSLLSCPVYVPVDEDLYRSENNWLNAPSPLSTFDNSEVEQGIIPVGVNVVVFYSQSLVSEPNLDIVENIFSSLPSGGVMIFLDNNNYQTTYIAPEVDLYDDLAKAIKSIDNSKCYHISTGTGFTVLIKD
jgi:hypothetical protein